MKISQYEIDLAKSLYSNLPYHNFHHAVFVMTAIDSMWFDDKETYTSLRRAALWHDVIYVPGATDNEERSADLLLAKFDDPIAADLIRRTTISDHLSSEPTNNFLLDALLDADLTSLAVSYPLFMDHQLNILAENKSSDVSLTAKFLTKFLDKPRIYRTEKFFHHYETSARKNICRLVEKFG